MNTSLVSGLVTRIRAARSPPAQAESDHVAQHHVDLVAVRGQVLVALLSVNRRCDVVTAGGEDPDRGLAHVVVVDHQDADPLVLGGDERPIGHTFCSASTSAGSSTVTVVPRPVSEYRDTVPPMPVTMP